VKNQELAEWLGLTRASVLFYLAFGAAVGMFFVSHPGLDILLAVSAVSLALLSCVIGIKRNPKASAFTNKAKRITYPAYAVFILLVVVAHYIISPPTSGFVGSPRSHFIVSSSMAPTLQIGDRVHADWGRYRSQKPKRGEIIVFQPVQTSVSGSGAIMISRIVGLPNELLEVRDRRVLINKKPLQESYIFEPPNYRYGPLTVPEDSYFVLADNRNKSYDLIGRVNSIWWPWNRRKALSK
jgi:signal peptidase I